MDVGAPAQFTLEELAEREAARGGIVLFDSNVVGLRLPEQTYDCKKYRSIDPGLIERAHRELDLAYAFISHPHVHTVANVTSEIQQGVAIMRERVQFWNRRLGNALGKGRVKTIPPQKAAIESFTFAAFRLAGQVRNAVYQPREASHYTALARAIFHVEEQLRVKHFRTQREHGVVQRRSLYSDLHTDEQLLALAIYLPLVEQKPATLVTTDCDLPRLFATFHAALTLSQAPAAASLVAHFSEFPLQLYFPVRGNQQPYALRTLTDMREMVRSVPHLAEIPLGTVVETLPRISVELRSIPALRGSHAAQPDGGPGVLYQV